MWKYATIALFLSAQLAIGQEQPIDQNATPPPVNQQTYDPKLLENSWSNTDSQGQSFLRLSLANDTLQVLNDRFTRAYKEATNILPEERPVIQAWIDKMNETYTVVNDGINCQCYVWEKAIKVNTQVKDLTMAPISGIKNTTLKRLGLAQQNMLEILKSDVHYVIRPEDGGPTGKAEKVILYFQKSGNRWVAVSAPVESQP